MLDWETERKLYGAYRNFFTHAERERRWDLWNDVAWDQVRSPASDALVPAVMAAYVEEVFLPDYSQRLLHLLRSSRGRAWFVTRWSYEEAKHSLALNEWLLRTGRYTDEQLTTLIDGVLAETTRDLAIPEPVPALVLALAREHDEIARYRTLGALARSENDMILAAVCDQIVGDEQAHAGFFQNSLRLIQEREPALVAASVRRVIALPEIEPLAESLREELGVA